VKIGGVHTEIALLIVKKEEITEGKIYSLVVRFAERAKQNNYPGIRCTDFAIFTPNESVLIVND